MLGVSPRPLPGVSASSENKQRVGASEQRAHNLVGVHMLDFCVFGPTAQSARARLGSAATLTMLEGEVVAPSSHPGVVVGTERCHPC